MTSAVIADLLAAAVPAAKIFSDGGVDGHEIQGLRPRAAVQVTSAEDVAAVLALAGGHGWSVAPRGGGTMLDLGNAPTRLDLVLDLRRLNRIIDYQPDDLTVTVEAGMTLGEITRHLAERGQILALDVPLPERATIGGALAANAWGPRRLRFGTARDLVIGMQTALPGAGLARSGGKVVKNVAGYDLAKLQIGGLGTTGIITEVTFKLWPAPAASGAAVAVFDTAEEGAVVAQRLLEGQLFPAALELLSPTAGRSVGDGLIPDSPSGRWTLATLFLGAVDAVNRQLREVSALCRTAAASVTTILTPEQEQRLFAGIRDYGREGVNTLGGTGLAAFILRASVLPSQTMQAIGVLRQAGGRLGAPAQIIAHPGCGVVHGHWSTVPVNAVAAVTAQARAELAALRGTLTVERLPPGVAGVDAWGISGADVALMRRLKQAYDPAGILNPGRFVAGI